MARWLGKILAPQSGGAPPAGWYASTTGNAGNSGSIGSPWDLQTALDGGPSNQVQPGDTIWVRGGTYVGLYRCTLTGTVGAPVLVKPYQNEQPTIDGYLHTTLTGAMDASQDTVPMAAFQSSRAVYPGGTLINIDNEAILVHGYSGGNYTGVHRGWNGTTTATHLMGADVYSESGNCIVLLGDYTHLYEIETTVSVARWTNRFNPNHTPGDPGDYSNPFGRTAGGIDIQGTGNKAINCIAHDGSDGITTANAVANDFEMYGCLSYYAGWDSVDRGHGHSFYVHNDNPSTSTATLGSVISLAPFNEGGQVYTGGATLGNIHITGWIGAQAGVISTFGAVREVLMGAASGITSSSFNDGACYGSAASANALTVGYGGGAVDTFDINNNYLAGQAGSCSGPGSITALTGAGNVFVGPRSAVFAGVGTNPAWKPGSGKAFVIAPNSYEAGRANIAVFNWDHSATVDLDLSSFLNVNDPYVIRNAWDFFGTPVASGTYGGGTVTVAAQGLTVAAPVGLTAPAETGPEFNIYIVRKI